MKKSAIIFPLFLLLACGNEKTEDTKKPESNSEKGEQIENESNEAPEITELTLGIEIDSKKTAYKGEVVASATWKDGRGKNIIIISEKPQYFWKEENPSMGKFCKEPENESELTELFAYHYIWSEEENKWKGFWIIHDFLFGCCDVYMNYQPESLKIEDTDGDGNAESVFFYTIGQGTMSIDRYFEAKLIYHPDETKLKVSGTTGGGKKWIESPENDGKPVPLKFEGFTAKYATLKSQAERYWNECHERQVKKDKEYLDEIEKQMEDAE